MCLPFVVKTVSQTYNGASIEDKRVLSMLLTITAVVLLPAIVIGTIGKVCNAEYADRFLMSEDHERDNQNTGKDIMSSVKCIVYRRMFKKHVNKIMEAVHERQWRVWGKGSGEYNLKST